MQANKFNPKISVIIPVFNCEKYIEDCLKSITLQTYENLEIICVDDGSTDNSLRILKDFEKKDSRIKIVSQKNCGQSCARNKGLLLAKGDYISFIDADDIVSLSLYEKFCNGLAKSGKDLDIYMFNACHFDKTQETKNIEINCFFDIRDWHNRKNDSTIHTFDDCMNPFSGNMAAYNKIYNKEFLQKHSITFAENLIFEDQYFYIKTFLYAESILINSEALYRYRMNNTSSTMNTLSNNVFNIFEIIKLIEDELRKKDVYEDFKYAFLQHKYQQYSYLFLRTKFTLKPLFYKECKKRLFKEKGYDTSICEKLAGYSIYQDILNLNWLQFYFKYRKKLK